MCGIFGVVKNDNSKSSAMALAVISELGTLSMERGRDSSGVAFIPRDGGTGAIRTPTQADARLTSYRSPRGSVEKSLDSFEKFWDAEAYLWDFDESQAIIGHTRKATQGSTTDLANASPMVIGSPASNDIILGTHNGDVTKYASALSAARSRNSHGSTDTELLFRQIESLNSHRKKIADLLSRVPGRIALAWADTRFTDRVYLARGAFSPLAIAWDSQGNLYWASNPRWFRDIDEMFDGAVGFRDITMIGEGRLLTINTGIYAGKAPYIENVRHFTPTARASDERSASYYVWALFDEEDRAKDQANLIHKVETGYTSKATTSYSSTPQFSQGNKGKKSSSASSYQNTLKSGDYDSPWESYAYTHEYAQASTKVDDSKEAIEERNLDKALFLVSNYEAVSDRSIPDNVSEIIFQWACEGFSHAPLLAANSVDVDSPESLDSFRKDFGLDNAQEARDVISIIRAYGEHEVAEKEKSKTVVTI